MTAPPAKVALRAQLRTRLLALDAQTVRTESAALQRHLKALPQWRDARAILGFLPLPGEPDLAPSLRDAMARGVRVALPRTDWTTRRIIPTRVTSLDDGPDAPKPGRFGLREPDPAGGEIPPTELDLVLVPALAFDRTGARLGRGAGFYDRFLTTLGGRTALVGVALRAQVVERVPTEPHDARVHIVITPDGVARR